MNAPPDRTARAKTPLEQHLEELARSNQSVKALAAHVTGTSEETAAIFNRKSWLPPYVGKPVSSEAP